MGANKLHPDDARAVLHFHHCSELRRLETSATTSISRIAEIALAPGLEVRHQQLVKGLATHALKSSVNNFDWQVLLSVVLANARHLEVGQLINLLALPTKPGAEVLKDGQSWSFAV
ncbi:MAG: hypothetical protein ACOYNA_08820 [Burkholderiaceae bacterium]|jgi:hypothetical protein